MVYLTEDVIEGVAHTNFHKDFNVNVPERISPMQLYRWLVFKFMPLPRNIELQLSHLPIFNPEIMYSKYADVRTKVREKAVAGIWASLESGVLKARGYAKNQEKEIPCEYWRLPVRFDWEKNIVDLDRIQRLRLAQGAALTSPPDSIETMNDAANDYKEKNGTTSYSKVTFATHDIIRVFDGLELTDGHVLHLEKQVKERVSLPTARKLLIPKKKRGAKVQHDWEAYREKFDELIAYHGVPRRDDPEWKNQAAVVKALLQWGENGFSYSLGESTMRSYVSDWLEEILRQ